MSPFQVLGIQPDADITTIKRAYARLLKQHRPDDDPVEFQRVNEAYQACQAHAQRMLLRRPTPVRPTFVEVVGDASAPTPAAAEEWATRPPSQEIPTPSALHHPVPQPSSSRQSSPSSEPDPTPETAPPTHFDPSTKPDSPTVDQAPLPAPQPAHAADPPAKADEPGQQPRVVPLFPQPARANTPVVPTRLAPLVRPRPATPPMAAPPLQTFNFSLTRFVDELCECDSRGHVELQNWLQRYEPLYALGFKQAITAPLMQALAQRQHPISPDGLRVVLAFFGMDTVSPERRSIEGVLLLLDSRSRASWSVRQASNPTTPTSFSKKKRGNAFDRYVARELLEPFKHDRRTTIVLVPGLKSRMRRLLAEIPSGIGDNDPMFNSEALRFWRGVLDPARVSAWRIASMAAQVATFLLLIATIVNDWTIATLVGYATIGAVIEAGWLALALNDARKVRRSRMRLPPGRLQHLLSREFRKPRNLYRRAVILLIPGLRPCMRHVLPAFPPGFNPARDPDFDVDAFQFWRATLDPARVNRWRILSMCANVVLVVVTIALLTWDPDTTIAFSFIGVLILLAWLVLATNDAKKLRNSSGHPGSRTGSVVIRGGGMSWRWIIWLIIAVNAIIGSLSHH